MSTAMHLANANKNRKIIVLEKENALGLHQSSHNSGVIHCGIYYKTGSLRAKMCVQGLREMYQYCGENNIRVDKCGKLIVAVTPAEVEKLSALYQNGLSNGVQDLELLDSRGILRHEPHCTGGLAAIYSPHTGIVSYREVTESYGQKFLAAGGKIALNFEVARIDSVAGDSTTKITSKSGQSVRVNNLVTCGGLHSDRLAAMAGGRPSPPIIPFRGEFLRLQPQHRHLVKGLIYPVPDPRFPFLGVHFTKKIDGNIDVGPNAVLAFAREGYRYTDINLKDLVEFLQYSGMQKLLTKHWSYAVKEFYKSLLKSAQVRFLQQYIPAVQSSHLGPGPAGVRAMAIGETGALIDDFLFETPSGNILNVRNAPSPAATSSLVIGREIVRKIDEVFYSGGGPGSQ